MLANLAASSSKHKFSSRVYLSNQKIFLNGKLSAQILAARWLADFYLFYRRVSNGELPSYMNFTQRKSHKANRKNGLFSLFATTKRLDLNKDCHWPRPKGKQSGFLLLKQTNRNVWRCEDLALFGDHETNQNIHKEVCALKIKFFKQVLTLFTDLVIPKTVAKQADRWLMAIG